jgi:superfamily II DNA or RNA helicase
VNLPTPATYAYQKNGLPAPPLLMQRLIAYRVLKERRVGNWSGVGAGKTVSAILAALVTDAKLTIILAFNSTLENWEREIKAVCPIAQVVVKERGPFTFAPDRPAFVVMNYESFQQEWAEKEFIPNVLSGNPRLDFIVIDEIQSVRQRGKAEESTRRRTVRMLAEEAAKRNPDLRVLGMSATPVINDLHESRVTLEMVTGQDMCELPTRFSVSNAITHHQFMIRHGVRFRPKEESKVDEQVVEVDGSALKDDLARLKIKVSNIAYLEQTLLKAKLPVIANHLTPGTLVYTQFVEGMVDELTVLAKRLGLSVGVFTGEQKDGLDKFKSRLDPTKSPEQRCDILIGSSPVGTGIDGLQQVGNQLIFACLPWTSAEYEQIVGRLNRKGVVFDRIKVVIPQVNLLIDGNVWSWDRYRLQCIRYKRTLADAVIDGVVPEGRLPTRDEMYRQSVAALQDWITQVEQASTK